MTRTRIIEAEHLSKDFPRPGIRWHRRFRERDPRPVRAAVDDVSLEIAAGEVVGLVGESGSGKSTLGKTLLGLHDKTRGTVRFRGEALPQRYRPADFQRLAGRMQMIFQDAGSALNPRMTVEEIVGEGLALHPDRRREASAEPQVLAWLERVGLDAGHRSRYSHELSGGQRQRVGIARALILEPEFVICDEPISMLDVSVQAQVVNLLRDLKAERSELAMMFIAHDLSMVRYLSDRMAVMYLGAVVEEGPADRVFRDPRHPYTRMLVQSTLEPDPVQARRRSTASPCDVPPPVFRPEAGCRFASRCPLVMDTCRAVSPALEPVPGDPDRLVACHVRVPVPPGAPPNLPPVEARNAASGRSEASGREHRIG